MTDHFIKQAISGHSEGLGLIEKLLGLTQPKNIFGEPTKVGDQTLITASEHLAAMGYGFGAGGTPTTANDNDAGGSGGGGGGGGYAASRPIAVIAVGPHGVKIEPVIDQTKVALAFFTMLGTLLVLISRMRQAARAED